MPAWLSMIAKRASAALERALNAWHRGGLSAWIMTTYPPSGSQIRRLLLVGFGGVLVLLAFTSLNALSVLSKIQNRNESIRRDYVNRDSILEQLRSDIYLSGTYVRDLLFEQDPKLANEHRRELETARVRIDSMIAAYDRILQGDERKSFQQFTGEVATYFDSLRPALQWDARQRRELGYAFMKNSLLPRRMVIVRLADRIGEVNQHQMEAGNRQVASLFSSFRRLLLVLLVLTLVCGSLLAAGSIYRILRLERLSAVRFDEVAQARAVLQELSARLIAVQESERRALSRELHDEVGQSLSALLLGIDNVAAAITPDTNPEARSQLHDLRRLGEQTVATVRDMSLLLRPSMLDDLGLLPALQWQAREVSRTKNLNVQVQADPLPDELSDEYRTCIYRIVQEALHNTARHARAKNVQVRLSCSGANLRLVIRDDGQGFVPEQEKGLGLLGMEERVSFLKGSFRIESSQGVGTTVTVELPLVEGRAKIVA
jgi:signal transduction histidine kinase